MDAVILWGRRIDHRKGFHEHLVGVDEARFLFSGFFVTAAEALIEAMVLADERAAGGQAFAPHFRFGRRTQCECHPEPPSSPAVFRDAVEENLIDGLGLSWTQAAALAGVRTRDRALPEDSGFDGFWVSQQRARIASSQYSINRIAVGWARE